MKSETLYFFGALAAMAAVVAGIIIVPKLLSPAYEERYTYNFFEFTKMDGTWFTQAEVEGRLLQVALRGGPRELEQIPVTGNIAGFRDRYNFFYVAFDPREENHDKYVTMSSAEISPNLVLHFNKGLSAACTVEDDVCTETETPVVTCSSTAEGVIFLNRAPGPSVDVTGNCAVITGIGEDMVRAADRFMYGMYGIMR